MQFIDIQNVVKNLMKIKSFVNNRSLFACQEVSQEDKIKCDSNQNFYRHCSIKLLTRNKTIVVSKRKSN